MTFSRITKRPVQPVEIGHLPDADLQRVAFKAANHGWQEMIAACSNEFQKRGLKPQHAYYRTQCDWCEGTALYRVGSAAFCMAHKDAARFGRSLVVKAYENRQNERELFRKGLKRARNRATKKGEE